MSASNGTTGGTGRVPGARRAVLPRSKLGWSALAVAAVGLGTWVILPMITMAFRDSVPLTDTWVMPAAGLALTGLAAVFNVLATWRWKERSALNVIAAALLTLIGLMVAVVLVGGAITGA